MLDLNHDTVFAGDGPTSVEILASAARAIVTASVEAGRNETGGILIGRYGHGGESAVVTEATPRPKGSKFGWMWFKRSSAGLAEMLELRWRDGLHYLGEWHFHPGGSPEPSGRDVASMRSIASSSEYQCREPILLILGGRPPADFAISVTVHPSGDRLIRLRKSESTAEGLSLNLEANAARPESRHP